MNTCIEISGASKTFDTGTVALQDIDLIIQTGEFVSLLGPSGCGKSTLLRIVGGLEAVTSGRVESDAAVSLRGGTGLVFQQPVLMPWATVFENVWMPLRLTGQSREQARSVVESMLTTVQLSDSASLYPRQLSGGMQMRVAIARALITKPDLLLLDEPFAALDEITRIQLNTELLGLRAKHGFTTLFVTHSVFESVFLSNRVIIMANEPGRIHAQVEINTEKRDAAFRSSIEFAKLCSQVSTALAEAMADTKIL